jgi:hypothetical protein
MVSGVPQLAIDLIELAVGAACLAGAVAVGRRGLPVVGAVLGLAGAAAVIHAVSSMLRR